MTGFTLRSGCSIILRISSSVGALSSAKRLAFGNPRMIFFPCYGDVVHLTEQPDCFDAVSEGRRAYLSSFSTLSYCTCANRRIFTNTQSRSFLPLSAKALARSSIRPCSPIKSKLVSSCYCKSLQSSSLRNSFIIVAISSFCFFASTYCGGTILMRKYSYVEEGSSSSFLLLLLSSLLLLPSILTLKMATLANVFST